ncbi:hypothetical protein [Deinococcus petrolearius]|uniref:Uncharacterized protein n=1 Tax=Deinococcus petrolearius TaxID=1751295 RepID=A0ABW1DGQ7_9DEIO
MASGQDQGLELELTCRSLAQRLLLLEDLGGRVENAPDRELIRRQLRALRAQFREAHLRWCVAQQCLRLDPWVRQALAA